MNPWNPSKNREDKTFPYIGPFLVATLLAAYTGTNHSN